MELQRIKADWDCPVIVAASGPSLTQDVAAKARRARWPLKRCRIVVVNDAYRLLPFADALYACDLKWWTVHKGAPEFPNEKWTTHEPERDGVQNDKSTMPKEWGVNVVRGHSESYFSTDPSVIHYGSNSGFQAVNLALLKGATGIVLVGFDMRVVEGKRHFFGDHPAPLFNNPDYRGFTTPFKVAAQRCTVPIINATPGSALDAFPMMELDAALDHLLHSNGSEPHARAS